MTTITPAMDSSPTRKTTPHTSTNSECSLANESRGRISKQCPVCFKSFDRKDTLLRHIRLHDKIRPPPKPRKKACDCCIRSKIKCLGERPFCSSCSRRDLTCKYSDTVETTGLQADITWPPSADHGTEGQAQHISLENLERYPAHHLSLQTPTSPFAGYPGFSGDSNDLDVFTHTNFDWNADWIFHNGSDDLISSGQAPLGNDWSSTSNTLANLTTPTECLDREPDENQQIGCITIGASNHSADPPQDRYVPDPHVAPQDQAVNAQPLELPRLGNPDQNYLNRSRYFQTLRVNASTTESLQNSLRLLQQSTWQDVSLALFPSKEKLDHCIDMYFKHFDWVLPVVHRPTFDPGEEPIVTLAIVCIGASYTEFEGARVFSNILSELLRRVLLDSAERDPSTVTTISYATAHLLQGAYSRGSGNRRLFDLAESGRSYLVHNARSIGLFRYRQPASSETVDLEQRWRLWIQDEKFRRLGWAIYGYDASASYLYNSRSYISIAEIFMDLQSSTEHWEASSMQAWQALHPWTDLPKNFKFRSLIRSFFDGTQAPFSQITDDHHRMPIILTLMRMLWAMKESEANPLSDFVQDRITNAMHKKKLLNVIDRFIDSPPKCLAMGSRHVPFSVVHRICTIHMAHLIEAGDMMDWLYLLLRGGPETYEAKARMYRWSMQDPIRVREVAYRSAQIMSIIRLYPYNSAIESINLFHAGAALWSMAILLSEGDRGCTTNYLSHAPTVYCIDHLGASGDPETMAIQHWVQHGGPEIVCLYGVPNLRLRDASQQVLELTAEILGRMRVWGNASGFLQIISRLKHEYSQQLSSVAL